MAQSGDAFAGKLKKFRADHDRMSQDKAAKEFGLSRATVNRWEGHGAGDATLDDLDRIAAVIGIKSYELIRPEAPDVFPPTRRAGDHLSPAHQRMIEIVAHMTDDEVIALLRCWESMAAIMSRAERK
jgi:transcriptional regulator with XRE-family HTH domain